jgi:bifunctional DNase/RNase
MSTDTMVPMTVEGVRRSFHRNDLYIVSLVDEDARRLFNFVIGQPAAYEMAMALHHIEAPRPTTLRFMAQALQSTGVVLEEVCIEQFRPSPLPVFYATAYLRNGENVQPLALDVRPSDALGLALLLNSPISVAADLLANMSIELPEGKTPEIHYAEQALALEGIALPEGKKLRLGYSKTPARDAVLKEIKSLLLGMPQAPGEKEFEQAKRAYLVYLLGEDFIQGEHRE